jgi:predicted glycosyltransferase involved in capsule biosynthesis
MSQPLLSIITCGKNDNYAGNFIQRLQHNLNKLNDNVKNLNVNDVEIIIADWGSEEKLSDILDLTNSEFIKFLHIPSDIAQKYSPDSTFSIVHALNAAFRKSQGDYIFFIDGDSYISFDSFKLLYDLIKTKKQNMFYWASRYHLPHHIHSNTLNIKDLDNEITIWEQNQKQDWKHDKVNLSNFSGTAMGLLLSKNICEESTLYYEILNKWGWLDIEMHNRISNVYPCMGDLEDLNMYFFHLDHHSIASGGQSGHNHPSNASSFRANNDSWGLINEDLTLYKK